jgi:hypothetical protein
LTKRRQFVLISLIAVTVAVVLLPGCQSSRVIKVLDTAQNRPVTNGTVVFDYHPEPLLPTDQPLFARPARIEVALDGKGEAQVSLRHVTWGVWIEDGGTNYIVSLQPADIKKGGQFRLYGPRPSFDETNAYPSKYLLELRKP